MSFFDESGTCTQGHGPSFPRADLRRGAGLFPSMCSPLKGRSPSCSQRKEGAERREALCIHRGSCEPHRPCEAGPPYGAPLRRFQSLVPHFLCPPALRRWREGVRDIDPRRHNAPGGVPPGTPGNMAANHARGRRSPFTFAAPRNAPQANGDARNIGRFSIRSKDKSSNKGNIQLGCRRSSNCRMILPRSCPSLS